MAYAPTGRPRGRPKTKQYESLVVRVPQDLAEQAKRYAARHRQSLSELLRDGLVWRIEQDTPGRPSRLPSPLDADDLPSMPDNGDTGIHELSPMLRAAIAAAVCETLDHVQSRPHREHGEAVIQQYPFPVLQHDTGESQDGAAACVSEHPVSETTEVFPQDLTNTFDATKFYLGSVRPRRGRGRGWTTAYPQKSVSPSPPSSTSTHAWWQMV
jgi:hypothetical protein